MKAAPTLPPLKLACSSSSLCPTADHPSFFLRLCKAFCPAGDSLPSRRGPCPEAILTACAYPSKLLKKAQALDTVVTCVPSPPSVVSF